MDEKTAGIPKYLPPPLIPAVALGLAALMQWIAPIPVLPRFAGLTPLFWTGATIALGAGILAGYAAYSLWRAGTPVEPWHATRVLVDSGPYRISRNPIYLSFLMGLLGISLAFSLGWGVVSLPFAWLALDRLIIAREERYLGETFGEAYEAFCQKTRRWF